MRKPNAAVLLCTYLILVGCGSPQAQTLKPTVQPAEETPTRMPTPTPRIDALLACEDFERIVVGDYVLNNNVWNKGQRTDYTQCVFAQGDIPPAIMGWRWDWPGSGRQIMAYPEVMYGDSPWDDHSPTGALPLPVEDCELLVTYDASQQASGRWNVALEMWLTSSLPPAEDNITDEVMIWVDDHDLVPGPPLHSLVTIDGYKYSLHVRRGHGDESGGSSATWSYIAFFAREPQLSGTLDMAKFLDYLLENEVIAQGRYVASLELGTEVASGEGEFTLRTYEISVP